MIATVEVQYVGLEGQAVGFDDEKNIYFVRGGVPGDVLEVEYESDKRRYRDARIREIVFASEKRTVPLCAHFPQCGGCDWLHWQYGAQLEAKQMLVRHVMERRKLDVGKLAPVIPAWNSGGYRSRVQLKVQEGRVGFHARGTNEIVEIESCYISRPEINDEIARLKKDPAVKSSLQQKVEVSVSDSGELSRVWNSPHAALGFTQANREQNENLQKLVAKFCARSKSRSVLELFCGDGNLTFAYLPQVGAVVGIDSNLAAIEKAREAAAGLSPELSSKVRFEAGYVTVDALRGRQDKARPSYDTLILDPPRVGAGTALEPFLTSELRSIIYVSCAPLTFSIDAELIVSRGFTLERVQPIDMFPQTRHIELVAYFSRSS